MNLFSEQKQIYRYQKQTLVTKGETWAGGIKSGAWDEHTHSTMYKIDNQQGPTV